MPSEAPSEAPGGRRADPVRADPVGADPVGADPVGADLVGADLPVSDNAPPPAAATTPPGTAPTPPTTPTTPTTPVAHAGAPQPVLPTAAPSSTPQVRRTPVTDQVAPQVVRLAQVGPGTHRIVLRLDPPDLGPVRVTLTVAEGAVRVRMAASSDAARAALLDASPELHRLLGAVHGAQTRISVHDLNSLGTFSLAEPRGVTSTPTDGSTAGSSTGSPGTADAGGHASGRERHGTGPHQSAPARMPVTTHATDGGTTEAITPQPIHTPGSRSRLDLSI